jgi:hypothetical protein
MLSLPKSTAGVTLGVRSSSKHRHRPHRPPTHPGSLLSTAHTLTRSPVPFRASSLSLSLALPSLLDLAGDPRPPCRSSSPPEASASDPELRPEVRHPSPRSVSPNYALSLANSALLEFSPGGPPRPHGDRSN